MLNNINNDPVHGWFTIVRKAYCVHSLSSFVALYISIFRSLSLYPNTIVVISVFMFLIMKMPNKKQQQQQDEKWNLSCKIKVKVPPCVASGNSIELNVYIKSRWIVICRIKQRNCAWLAIYVRCAICVPCAVPCAYDSHTLPVVLWGQ